MSTIKRVKTGAMIERLIKIALVSMSLCWWGAAEEVPARTPNAFVGSQSCQECHQSFYKLWSNSFHGLALQPFTSALGARLTPQTNRIKAGKFSFHIDLQRGVLTEAGPEGQTEYSIQQVAGGKNVYYFMTLLDRGWLQVLPVAYDVRRKEWYDTTASAVRHFAGRQDQALYWKERPLTFNTSCYNCHVSQLSKNYDLTTDSYKTTWAEPGINCETCHGPASQHAQWFKKEGSEKPAPANFNLVLPRKLAVDRRNDLCAPCHAKMSPVTDSFAPGDRFFDHFDLVGFESPDFYPDGRDLGENYTETQWRTSPCAASGKLDCVHCHTSSGRYRFTEVANANDACLPCHEQQVRNATTHTHHKAGSAGNRCVSCHMPTTEFARMRRTDHSMRPPTPATTLAYQSPNACNVCHTHSAQWADAAVRKWHGKDYQKPVLERAALLDAARKGDWKRLPEILAWLSQPAPQEIWAVSLVRLLPATSAADQEEVLQKLVSHPSPLVRAAIAEPLGRSLDATRIAALLKLAGDDYRLVRVRAANALAPLPTDQLTASQQATLRAATAELEQSFRALPDAMVSHYNRGNFLTARGAMSEAVAEFELASKLEPGALPPYVNAAFAHNALGQNEQAERCLRRAVTLDPTNAPVQMNLGMLLGEMEKPAEAQKAFQAAFAADPTCAQAAYNLGVLYGSDQPEKAIEWCAKATGLRPDEPKYAFTLAFFQNDAGKSNDAIRTLVEALQHEPASPDSYALLGKIYERENRLADALSVYQRASNNPKLDESARGQFTARIQLLKTAH